MNKKFELLREAVNTYKVNHCDGNKNEKELLEFIDELEQLTIPVVVGQSGQLKCGVLGGVCPYEAGDRLCRAEFKCENQVAF